MSAEENSVPWSHYVHQLERLTCMKDAEIRAAECARSDTIAALQSEIARMRAGLTEIDEAHIPDCPAHFADDELAWAQRHVARLRRIARAALSAPDVTR